MSPQEFQSASRSLDSCLRDVAPAAEETAPGDIVLGVIKLDPERAVYEIKPAPGSAGV